MSPLAMMITTYLAAAHAQSYATSTLASRRPHLHQFATWCATRGLVAAQDLTPAVLERYQAWLAERPDREGAPLSRATQANKLTAVRMLLAWATRTKRIVVNPAAELELPTLPKRLPRAVLSVAEVERVLAMPDSTTLLGLRDRAILEVLYSTGIRRMELVGLDVRDLDAERGALFVREGKGRKDRVVPIGARAIQWTQRYLDRVRTRLLQRALPTPERYALFFEGTRSAHPCDETHGSFASVSRRGRHYEARQCAHVPAHDGDADA